MISRAHCPMGSDLPTSALNLAPAEAGRSMLQTQDFRGPSPTDHLSCCSPIPLSTHSYSRCQPLQLPVPPCPGHNLLAAAGMLSGQPPFLPPSLSAPRKPRFGPRSLSRTHMTSARLLNRLGGSRFPASPPHAFPHSHASRNP